MKIIPPILLFYFLIASTYAQSKLVISNPQTYKSGAVMYLYQPVGDKRCSLSQNLSDSIKILGKHMRKHNNVDVQIDVYKVIDGSFIENGGLAICLLYEIKKTLMSAGFLAPKTASKLLIAEDLSSIFPMLDNSFKDSNIYFQIKIISQENINQTPSNSREFYPAVPANRRYFSFDNSYLMPGDIKILDMLFQFSSCDYYPEFTDTLDLLIDFLKKHPNIKVEVGVHKDSRGSKMMSVKYDVCRAESIMKYIISKGIPDANVTYVGYGETQPLISDDIINAAPTEELREKYHKMNRRVEVKILSIAPPHSMPNCIDNRRKFLYNDDTSIMPGDVRTIDVMFSFSRCMYYAEFEDSIDIIRQFLVSHPQVKVEISVHCDSRGDREANIKLTECRASRIGEYLMSKGISQDRYVLVGKGEDEPLCPESIILAETREEIREQYHKPNRRVEVKIISIN